MCLVLLTVTADVAVGAARAQEAALAPWNGPANVSDSSGQSTSPRIVADSQGVVHAIWLDDQAEGRTTILYAAFDDSGWTTPQDVLVTPGAVSASAPALGVDHAGNLHVVWHGGGSIWYSQVHVSQAGDPLAWQEPLLLIPDAAGVRSLDLATDGQRALIVAFAKSVGAGAGVHVVYSNDEGNDWEGPETVTWVALPDRMVDKPRLAIASDGTAHLTWTEHSWPEVFPPVGIAYARSARGDWQEWMSPESVADGPYDFPAIGLQGDSGVHVVWSGTGESRYKFHRASLDGGRQWGDVLIDQAVGGYQGMASVTQDAAGNVHWLQVGDISRRGVWLVHNQLRLGAWTGVSALLEDEVPREHALDAVSAVRLGNELHVLTSLPLPSGLASQRDIMHLWRLLDAPRDIPAEVPTAEDGAARPTSPASPTATPLDAAPTPGRATWADEAMDTGVSRRLLFGASLLPAVLIVAIVVWRRRRGVRA